MFKKKIRYNGKERWLCCDGQCQKAWGVCERPSIPLNPFDEDDYVFLSDRELGMAHQDPGTSEGGHLKPLSPFGMNKWCSRQCERSELCPIQALDVEFYDFDKRVYNISTHNQKYTAYLSDFFDVTHPFLQRIGWAWYHNNVFGGSDSAFDVDFDFVFTHEQESFHRLMLRVDWHKDDEEFVNCRLHLYGYEDSYGGQPELWANFRVLPEALNGFHLLVESAGNEVAVAVEKWYVENAKDAEVLEHEPMRGY